MQRYLRGQTHFEIEEPLNAFKDPGPKSPQGFLIDTVIPLSKKTGGKPAVKSCPRLLPPGDAGKLEVREEKCLLWDYPKGSWISLLQPFVHITNSF